MAPSNEQIQWLQKLRALAGSAIGPTGSTDEDPGIVFDLPSGMRRRLNHSARSRTTR